MEAAARPARPFKVVFDLHLDGRAVRSIRSFATAERAEEYAVHCTPDHDPKLYPNVRDASWRALEADGFEYWKGIRWHDNRPAVVMSWTPAIDY